MLYAFCAGLYSVPFQLNYAHIVLFDHNKLPKALTFQVIRQISCLFFKKVFFSHDKHEYIINSYKFAFTKLRVTIFCFVDTGIRVSYCSDRAPLVKLLQSGCTAYDASIFYVMVSFLMEPDNSGRWIDSFTYPINHPNFL